MNHNDRPYNSEIFIVRPNTTDYTSVEYRHLKTMIRVEYWADAMLRHTRTRIRNLGSDKYWPEEKVKKMNLDLMNKKIILEPYKY